MIVVIICQSDNVALKPVYVDRHVAEEPPFERKWVKEHLKYSVALVLEVPPQARCDVVAA
jgi:hypothetical protein